MAQNKYPYEASQIGAGKYTIRIKAEGYADRAIEQHEIKIGTMSTLNVSL